MGWWRRLLARAVKSTTSTLELFREVFGWPAAKSGVAVNVDTALQTSVVLACARVIAEGLAQVPLRVMRPASGGKGSVDATDHPLFALLGDQPNDWQTAFEFVEMLTLHAVLAGGGFAYINRAETRDGAPLELLPLLPGWVTIKYPARLGDAPSYEVRPSLRNGGAAPAFIVPAANMLHLRGPAWDGIAGLDMIRVAREAIGLAIATEEHHARMHANRVSPGGLLAVEGNLDDKSHARLKAYVDAELGGVANAHKTLIADRKATWTPFDMKGVDQQHLETRRHQVEEICRFLRVFPLMVMQADKTATFASAEQFFVAHVIHTLAPWARRWEQALKRDCIGKANPEFAKFALQGLMRGDAASRAAFYSRGILDGWMTRNEARGLEDLNPLDGLDEPLRPLNMGPGSQKPPPENTPAAPAPNGA